MTHPVKPESGGKAATTNPDFANFVNLLAVFSEASNRLAELQADVHRQLLETVDEHKAEYSRLQDTLNRSEAALEVLARQHPEWFVGRKSLKTPYGEAALKSNPPKLAVANEELSIVLVEQAIAAGKLQKTCLRERQELNLEVLAALTDDELAACRILRTQGDTFTVKPLALDLGKAVKAGEAAKADPAKN